MNWDKVAKIYSRTTFDQFNFFKTILIDRISIAKRTGLNITLYLQILISCRKIIAVPTHKGVIQVMRERHIGKDKGSL